MKMALKLFYYYIDIVYFTLLSLTKHMSCVATNWKVSDITFKEVLYHRHW